MRLLYTIEFSSKLANLHGSIYGSCQIMHHKFEASAAGVVVSVSFKRPFSCLTVSMTFFVVTLVSSRLGASSGVRGHLFTKTNLNDGCHQIVFGVSQIGCLHPLLTFPLRYGILGFKSCFSFGSIAGYIQAVSWFWRSSMKPPMLEKQHVAFSHFTYFDPCDSQSTNSMLRFCFAESWLLCDRPAH